jgi:hypothetical protein
VAGVVVHSFWHAVVHVVVGVSVQLLAQVSTAWTVQLIVLGSQFAEQPAPDS